MAPRIPDHAKPKSAGAAARHGLKTLLRSKGLHTVCESARCPNLGECFGRGTATFMILGDVCTRSCTFCAVKTGKPLHVDEGEPQRVAEAAAALGLKYVVITSVTRDDLADGGARQFALTVEAVRSKIDAVQIEVLIPDFQGKARPLETVVRSAPDIVNHNLETVPRLYDTVRPQADYARSLELIERASKNGMLTKSGLMLGMGEERDEVVAVMKDLRSAGCRLLTLGQYLRPSRRHLPVARYLDPVEFDDYRAEGLKIGFASVAAAPLVRSSYMADFFSGSRPATYG